MPRLLVFCLGDAHPATAITSNATTRTGKLRRKCFGLIASMFNPYLIQKIFNRRYYDAARKCINTLEQFAFKLSIKLNTSCGKI